MGIYLSVEYFLFLFFGVQILLTNGAAPTTGCNIVYDGYCHNIRRFSSTNLNWLSSQNECESREGDLSTIVSSTQNDLINGLTNSTYGRCWIGLNDRNNEAGNDGSAFVWVDGSTNAYRDFIDGQPDGSGADNSDCVLLNMMTSEKRWEYVNCSDALNCFFCEKSIPVFGRIIEGSTYESLNNDAVLISDTTLFCITETDSSMITWSYQPIGPSPITDITSQASWIANLRISEIPIYTSTPGYYSCEVTRISLTTTYTALIMEPNLLVSYTGFSTTTYTALSPSIIPIFIPLFSTQVKLSTNFVSGTWSIPHSGIPFTSVYSIQTFTLTTQGRYTFNTSQIVNNANVQVFILEVIATGIPLAIQTSPGEYTPTSNNEIFYTNTDLVCLTDYNTQVVWYYRNRNVESRTFIVSTTSSGGISVYSTQINFAQGLYSCDVMIDGNILTYTFGVFNTVNTTVLLSGAIYNYSLGIENSESWMLCDPTDNSIDLASIRITVNGVQYSNPVNLFNFERSFNQGQSTVECRNSTDAFLSTSILFQGAPNISLTYDNAVTQYLTKIPSELNIITIPLFTRNVQIMINLIGEWTFSAGTFPILPTINVFTLFHAGTYTFSTDRTLRGTSKLSSTLSISTSGSPFAIKTITGQYIPQSNNQFFYNNTDLVCLTDYSTVISWYYQQFASSNRQLQSSVTNEGISVYNTDPTAQQGFYSCDVMNFGASETYIAGVWDATKNMVIASGVSYSYAIGIDDRDASLLCDPGDSSVELRSINVLLNGLSFGNPLRLYNFRSYLHQGTNTIACRISGNSTPLSDLFVQGPPNISLTYDNVATQHFTEIPNEVNMVTIPMFARNVEVIMNLMGRWTFRNQIITTNTIDVFTLFNAGEYTFFTNKTFTGADTLASTLQITASGFPFAIKRTNQYIPQPNNQFFYNYTYLVCLTDYNSQVSWYYQETNAAMRQTLPSSTSNEGISVYSTVPSTQQGFYSCDVVNQGFSETYIAGVFDTTNTTVLVAASSYSYTIEIDSQNIHVLCDPTTSLNISDLNIAVNGVMLGNPLNVYNSRGVLHRGNESIKCLYNGSDILNANLLVQGPPVITLMISNATTTHNTIAPSVNSDSIRVLTKNVTLQTDLMGKWKGPDGIDIHSHTITITLFTADDAGLYQFYVTNWEGSEVLAIQISITAYGSNFAEQTGDGEYRMLSDNEIIYNDTTLICVTDDTSNRIEWTRKLDQNSSPMSVPSNWNVTAGVSTLSIMKTSQGYYRCQDQSAISYDVAIFNPDNTIIVTAEMSGMSYYYIKGVDSTDILLLCDLNNSAIALSTVKWKYLEREYSNPLKLNDLDAMGATSISCKVGTIVTKFSITLTIYDPSVTIGHNGSNFSTYNSSSAIVPITIPSFSQVQLSTNLESGVWVTPDSGIISSPNLTIQIFTVASQGIYVFKTTQTWNGIEKQLFILNITAGGSSIATKGGGREYIPQKNNTFFYNDASLICFTDRSTQVSWYFQPTTGLPKTKISSINNSIVALISMQGFYSCDIVNNSVTQTYIVGIFDRSKTIVLSSNTTYNYTISVDNANVWILCDTNDNFIDLKSVTISVNDETFQNPFNIDDSIQNIGGSALKVITCFYSDVILQNASLYIQGPPVLSVTYDDNIAQYYSNLSSLVDINIPLFAQNVDLTMNVLGKWDSIIVGRGRSITIDTFSLYNQEFYFIYTDYTWDGSTFYIGAVSTIAKGLPIAIKSGDVYNTSIVNNQIFFNDITLVCSSTSNSITWDFLQSSNAGFISLAETSSTTNGLSTLYVNTNKQGFYSCNIRDNSATKRYTIGVFDSRTTTVALSGVTHNYTIGVDREDILLLCDPKSDSINFNVVVWRLGNSNINLPNPLSVNDSKEELSFKDNEDLLCYNNDANIEIPTYRVFVQGPPLIAISYSDTKYLFSLSNLTPITIPLLTSSIELSINLRSGEWRRGLINSSGTYPTIQIDLFTAKHIGVYNYIFNFLDGREKEISVEINAIGPLIALKNTTGYFTLQNNTFGELNTELACFASNQDTIASSINWYYQEDIPSDPQMESGEYNDQLGATSINVVKRGIYTCRLQGDKLLSVWILELDENTQILSNEDLDGDDEMTYIIGESLTLFYLNPNISLTSIRWTTDTIKNEDIGTTLEFYNNIEISDVFAQLGSGAYTFSCFYRQSPITVVGGLNLNMKDTVSTNLAYNSALQGQFSDVINTNFPRPQSISIPILTKNIKLTCDKSMCEWLMQRNGTADYSVSDTEYVIDSLKVENQGLYSLRRNTSANVTYSTAGFILTVTGFTRQSIISLNHSDINIRPITLFWKLETVLPDEANQKFTISYTENGISYINTTTDTTFNLTDLIPGQTYTVYVTLSYAYTLEISNKSVEITVPLPQGGILLAAIIPAFLFLMIVLVIIIIILLIIIIFKMRKRKGKAFTTLNEDNAIAKTSNSRNSKEFGYTTLDTQLDNPVYNPDLTESMAPKSKFSESDPMMQEEKKYYNITDINDPRLRPIPLDVFKRHVDQLWDKENTLEEEYDSLGGDSFRYTCDKAQIAINKYKNKYKFIYPYDKSRVVLKKQGRDAQSDYINASHIPGLYVPQCFIASQGPKENTLQDFWRMIFEQNIVNIVMVTNLKEGDKQKCEAYFPENNGEWVEYGPYKLNNIKTDISIGNITRMFKVQSSKEKVLVKHFHFTAWPDHDVPTLYDELLVFVETVQETMIPSKAPILVHCSAGVGRTGAFITLFNLRSAISRMQPISIYEVVHEMREHRPHMVQTFRQYKFIYLAVLELLLGKTSIPAEDFTNIYNSYLESDQEGYVSVFFQQFSELNYQCKKSFYLPTNAADDNPEKNPSGEIVPFDYNRVVIYSPFFPCNYINASYHEGNQFITTIHPDAYTLVDFLQMVYQTEAVLVVMLATSKEKSKILGNMSDRKAYWPNKDAFLNIPPFEVSVTNSEKSTAQIKQTILLKNNSEQSERTFMQVISTAWNEKGETTDLPSILILLNFIIKYKHENPSKPIIIHCQDGIGKTGIIYTFYQCIQEMKENGQIDIFHTIKRLRRERINFVPTLTHFCSCFAVLNEYCSST